MKHLDFVIIAAALLIAAGFFLVSRLLSGEEAVLAEIYVDGKLAEILPLSGEITKTIHTGYGENTVQIGPDGVAVVDADCPGKDCVHSPAISKSGQSLACLPNRLLIRLSGPDNEEEVDAVAG